MIGRLIEYSIFIIWGLVVYVWGSSLNWDMSIALDRLSLFPLFGLIAFVTMWWHFLRNFVRRLIPDYEARERLYKYSGYFVFISIILHPALLISFSWDIGIVDPKVFYDEFVGADKFKFILLGYFGVVVFLAYDLARWLREKPLIKNNWHIVDAIDDAAFLAIWLHSLNLGRHVASGWFRGFWIILGLSGLFFIAQRYYFKITGNHETAQTER